MADPNSPLARFQVWRATLPPALRWLLTVNLATYAVFVLLSVLGAFGLDVTPLLRYLALPGVPAEALGQPWSVLTYSVLNLYGDIWGLISFAFGMYWLNWLGRDYEDSYGGHRLLGLYVLTALGGAALALAIGAGRPMGPFYFGVWGPATGVLCAVATLHPDRPIGLFLLGVVPLKWIAIAFVVLDLAFVRDPTHLGAAATGALFALAQKRQIDLAAWARPLFERRPRSARASAPSTPSSAMKTRPTFARPVRTAAAPPSAPPARTKAAATDVDRILDKILEQGYESLTAAERKTLDEASRD